MTLPLTYVEYPGDGVTTDFTIPFTYDDESEVVAHVNGVEVAIASFPSANTVRLAAAPATDADIFIFWSSPREAAHEWASSAMVKGADLNRTVNHLLKTALQARDQGTLARSRAIQSVTEAEAAILAAETAQAAAEAAAAAAQGAEAGVEADAVAAAASAADAAVNNTSALAAATAAAAAASAASGSQSAAGTSASAAAASASAASGSQSAAASSASAAATSATNAAASATTAAGHVSTANSHKNDAAASAAAAAASAANASDSEAGAATALTSIGTAVTDAEAAATAAEAAQAAAEEARDDAIAAAVAAAGGAHIHDMDDVTGLAAALAGKASTSHGHAIADTSGLQTALDGKAASSHSHATSDVTGLDAALAGKAASSHSHAIADTTGLQTALDGKAASSHTHTTANVTGLDTALAAKAPLASPALTGTPTAPTAAGGTNTTQIATTAFVASGLSGKANSSHTHAQSDITNLATDLAAKAPTSRSIGVSGLATGGGDLSANRTIGVPAEDAAGFRTGTATNEALTAGGVWGAADIVTLTDASTIAVDMATFINAAVTAGGNRTLGNPTNPKVGQTGTIYFIQDATGGRTLAFASNWKAAGGEAPEVATAANAVTALHYKVRTSTFIEVTAAAGLA